MAAGAWEGVRNGTVAPPLCPQPDAPSDWTHEDCLYLSVYTPQVSRLGKRSARGRRPWSRADTGGEGAVLDDVGSLLGNSQ